MINASIALTAFAAFLLALDALWRLKEAGKPAVIDGGGAVKDDRAIVRRQLLRAAPAGAGAVLAFLGAICALAS